MSLEGEIVECGVIQRCLCELLESLCGDASRMHQALVQAYPTLRGKIPGPEGLAPDTFAFRAVEPLLRHRALDLDGFFDQLAWDYQPRCREIQRVFLPLSFLRALPATCLDGYGRAELARMLRPKLAFAKRELDRLERGPGSAIEPLASLLHGRRQEIIAEI